MRELTGEWVAKAEDHFYSADLVLHAGQFPIPDTACFHCQQSAEKYLKGFLQEHQVQFLRHHNLKALLDLCVGLDGDFETLRDDLHQLEDFAVAVRYPGVHISSEIAEQALGHASRIREFVRTKLEIKS